MPNYEYEWSQPVAVEKAFLELKDAKSEPEIRAFCKDYGKQGQHTDIITDKLNTHSHMQTIVCVWLRTFSPDHNRIWNR